MPYQSTFYKMRRTMNTQKAVVFWLTLTNNEWYC